MDPLAARGEGWKPVPQNRPFNGADRSLITICNRPASQPSARVNDQFAGVLHGVFLCFSTAP